MNDKQQLAAMGAEMAEQQQQPLCMAKRIEELEGQVRVMAGLLREAHPYVKDCSDWGGTHDIDLRDAIDAALAGTLPVPVVPEGWRLVPADVSVESEWVANHEPNIRYRHEARAEILAILAAAPKPEAK